MINEALSTGVKVTLTMLLTVSLTACQLTLSHTSSSRDQGPAAATSAPSFSDIPVHAITPEDSYALLQEDSTAVLIDVRGPSEVRFDGNLDYTRVHVPLLFVNTEAWNEAANAYAMRPNENFLVEIERDFQRLGVTKDQQLIFMCRSGIRGEQAANKLREAGYTNVHFMLGGFDGFDPEGYPGWRDSGLPWVQSIKRDVAWGRHRL